MSAKSVINALPELVEAGLITTETASAIEVYLEQKRDQTPNRLLLVFAILGALLTGLGIILIIAHNWDKYNQLTKTAFAFLPLIIGQLFAGFTILRKPGNVVWQEASSVFLTLAIGASISLVSQIYNLLGDLSSFLFWWTLLSLPLVYLLNSSMASLLFWCGATYFGCQAGYFDWSNVSSISASYYWLFVLGGIPYYYLLVRRAPTGNFTNFHHFIVPISLVIMLGAEPRHHGSILLLAYMSLFGLLHLIGTWIKTWRSESNISGYQLAGKLGPIGILMWFSFLWAWGELHLDRLSWSVLASAEFFWFSGLTLLSLGLMVWLKEKRGVNIFKPFNFLPLVFAFLFFLSMINPFLSAILDNLLVLGLGIVTVVEGSRSNSVATLNVGLLTLTALLICRFFDLKIDFVVRGILFIVVGVGFFLSNYWLIKKKKA